MPIRWDLREHLAAARYFLKWLLIAAPLGVAVGSAVALFLWSLDAVTRVRFAHPWLLFLLPVGGVLVAVAYRGLGKDAEGGNNLIIEQVHEPGAGGGGRGAGVPWVMAPLVLAGTLVTHLFGGSAGREGTAVQMGGSLAATAGRLLRLKGADVSTLLMVGVAAGFGAVFGTPITGTVFALEVLAIGRLNYAAVVPCLIGGIVGDQACTAWHIQHTTYRVAAFAPAVAQHAVAPLEWALVGKVTLAAVAFGLAGLLFAELTHGFQWLYRKVVPWPLLRPAAGGLVVIALAVLVGTRDYLGLGVTADPNSPTGVSIVSAFAAGGATPWSWWWKVLFTAATVGAGFKGGEVTPLFFVGATLGNAIGIATGAPVDLMAALGFVAVFAGATNTPLACTIMAVELFAAGSPGLVGSGFVVYAAIACFVAYLVSGHSGIYLSQRVGVPKTARAGHDARVGKPLRQLRGGRP
ncbi:MAG TPA: voltage-gated chloride channel family protein [Humisphaera sp.]